VRGETLRPARRSAIFDWFETEAPRLAPGDVLLIYVTDHGRKNQRTSRTTRSFCGAKSCRSRHAALLAMVPEACAR
jgi:hypothetical protein